MIVAAKELDDLAYLLYADVHRVELERMNNPSVVEERK